MWGRPLSEHKHDDDTIKEGKNIAYKTEQPIYDPSNLINSCMTTEDNINSTINSQIKSYYPIDLTSYNKNANNNVNNINNVGNTSNVNNIESKRSFHPYYPSMDKNAMVLL